MTSEHYITLMQTLGGLGVFLLGMIVMTDGLRALAGPAMRQVLVKFTRSPLTGALTGAGCTAILQSSSATTVAAVGFVGAGVMSFSEALGIIFGANIGTTITGWLVVLVGFKLQLATVMLPVILVGVVLKLFSKNKLATLGYALAGFGLIFVGISMMQQGMTGVEQIITPESFPPDTWLGRIQLVLLGVLITLITQSSSAGVAAALTALFAGAINFNQAAALVIGMDLGTTATAAMATIGGSIGSRRTGFSHVIYNGFTAVGALLLLTPFTYFSSTYFPGSLTNNAEVALVAFHTTFNIIGVIVVLPFTKQFAAFIKKVIAQNELSYVDQLDSQLLAEPSVALTTVFSTLKVQLHQLLSYIQWLLNNTHRKCLIDFAQLQIALDETHAYVDLIHLDRSNSDEWNKLINIIHVLDHMQRIHERCDEASTHSANLLRQQQVDAILEQVRDEISQIATCFDEEQWRKAQKIAYSTRKNLAKMLEPVRNNIMERIAQGELTVPQATELMEGMRWLQRIINHIARIAHHLSH
ncbi:Na/Pi cotransporter family protein [Thalassotalea ganghwensis]